ncbi:MAG: long-chain fatty acid--CoA ligase [Solirubrobacterales bacterium]|nr:long-chain fatty acid--CoA ligase [Solirubrobacterales bacterium]
MSGNLANNLVETASRHGDRPALKLDDVVIDYKTFDDVSARVAAALRARGLEPGDRVGIMLPNVPHFALAYYGVLRAGGVVVPMNVLLKRREVEFYLEDSGAKELFVWSDFAEAAPDSAITVGPQGLSIDLGDPDPEVVARDGSDDAVILYTSGTTGKPKGAQLTHDNLRSNVEAVMGLFTFSEEDVVLGALPLFHSFGQTCSLNSCVRAGGLLSLLPRFEPGKALEILQRDAVTIFMGVPTMYGALLHDPGREGADLSKLRLCVSGGASLPVELMRAFEDAFGCIILEGYGLSETSPVASFNHPDRERKPGSIGTPIRGVEMKVVDDEEQDLPAGEVGEIVIRGHNVMKGYWQQPEATESCMKGGWFHTGDMAKVDEDGYFFIVDRKKDLIIRGGYNVYPREIEEVLYEHPAVREAAVIGVPHEEWGEEVGAAVALKEGESADPEELKAFVKDQVAAYKYPRQVWIVDDLPKGPTGKILKREIEAPGS